MDIKTVHLTSDNDHLKVKKLMEDKEKYIAVAYDNKSVSKVNIIMVINVIKDLVHMYRYKIVEYGLSNNDKENEKVGYLIERIED
ncbi:hypothetical protein O151_gp102 [Staphylococcus phage vB_SauM_Remus]|uniref:Uncharacterized protein n=5 Tax=Silviavirus remus TaxID=1857890 RepID=S4T9B2_9CAUD|nr:hypothetical protein QLX36_gp073 [Staphylococcus phage vB_SauM_Romulus]YP_008431207.1 hypothetical protein O151_gp102 [Staphylococcus phage vB_SauM_Remus]QVD57586.1 hypothetical protein PM56_041 [Staphylococcus phage PM56]QVD58479.1 hypothetical protein PM93_052 [Staphylococcus phage PM93]QVD58682.1 hypothetical protein Remus_051 [Silviavirus remus]QVD58873.1 hypothetical protein Romulus_041 [Staphylococcus phage Romulus]AFV80967.1 hypothetical protein Remus_088 [Staphylococcus phage vB_Sa